MKSPGRKSKAEETLQAVKTEAGIPNGSPPTIYYDIEKRDYLQENTAGRWIGYNQAQIKRRLRGLGFSNKVEGDFISPIEEIMTSAEDNRDVRYAAPLAGRKAGFYDENGIRFLVTESPQFIEARKGDWPTIRKLLNGLFVDQDSQNGREQLSVLFGWLKHGIIPLRNGQFTQAQALAICGPANCGKSLLQKLFTKLLGGRSAKGARYMMGKTEFNAELFEVEHIMLEDEHMSRATRDRVALGAQIKNVTVSADTVSCHRKGRTAINLGAWWRISITLNDNPESLTVLPPLNDDFTDKIILLKAFEAQMPMPTHTAELKKAFWERLMAELPAFLNYLINEHDVPPEQLCERYGIATWHHPSIAENLHSISPESALLKIIDRALWNNPNKKEWKGSSEELRAILLNHEDTRRDAAKLLDYDASTGTYLGRLAENKLTSSRVKRTRSSKARFWIISRNSE